MVFSDFAALPPEVISTQIYTGPGAGPLLAAAAAWEGLAAELHSTAASYGSVISELVGESWQGQSSESMAAAAEPYVAWMSATAGQAEETAAQARAAASAYEAALAAAVPPVLVAANRSQLAALLETNILGQNDEVIAATEDEYAQMWAQDVAAMFSYASASESAGELTAFEEAPATSNATGQATQAVAAATAQSQSLSSWLKQLEDYITPPLGQYTPVLAEPDRRGHGEYGDSSLPGRRCIRALGKSALRRHGPTSSMPVPAWASRSGRTSSSIRRGPPRCRKRRWVPVWRLRGVLPRPSRSSPYRRYWATRRRWATCRCRRAGQPPPRRSDWPPPCYRRPAWLRLLGRISRSAWSTRRPWAVCGRCAGQPGVARRQLNRHPGPRDHRRAPHGAGQARPNHRPTAGDARPSTALERRRSRPR